MRLKLTFHTDKEYISLPLHHNTTLQGMFYKSLPPPLSEFLHEIGFFYNGRRFKLFTFSKINSEKFVILNGKKGKRVKYKSPITIQISSGIPDITKNWGETFLKKHKITLGKNELYLESIEVVPQPKFSEDMIIRTLAPITVYRTFQDEKKYYRYYSPDEEEFEELIRENLRKKYEILTGNTLNEFKIEIKPKGKVRKVLFKYKDFPIEGYEGKFIIKTDPELFKKVYDTGLGAKNSQGFGMVEVMSENKKKISLYK
ncbi:CRISPR-associated endoribonuclease Cas6 [Persephonella hydrogeniphila]|uniref:CRISPR-associated endoribonuclease n=1 Tax=Persephonella hydrogeniphila TaxID=198703 RepID=A0A285NMC8_9AQUI|nr:CRISPR-associated endoribonuclease Cas6 [Persephonella hydrogeniphila]SNZ10615.1 CRISPR-associated endoribonuclease Cas6 [Persephonella hydrogeniphila]